MDYESAVIVIRMGLDDFTLWWVDLPEEYMQKVQESGKRLYGELRATIMQTAIPDGKHPNTLNFLFQTGKNISICPYEVSEEFLNEYSGKGCSVRGTAADIEQDALELFQELSVPMQFLM